MVATFRFLLALLSFILPAIGETQKAWVEIGCPKDGEILPPTFGIDLVVFVTGDIKVFARQFLNGAELCIRLSCSEGELCNDYREPSLNVSDLPLGHHSIWAWVRSGDGSGKIVIEPNRSDFKVVTREQYTIALQQGFIEYDSDTEEERRAAIAKENAMVEHSIVEWHHRHLINSSEQQQTQRRAWTCHGRSRPPDLMIGIKTYARGFSARDAMRRTWLDELDSHVCAWFLIGALSAAEEASTLEQNGNQLSAALRFEQELYGDLLLEQELGSINGKLVGEDGYFGLVDKTKAFMRYATAAPAYGTRAPTGFVRTNSGTVEKMIWEPNWNSSSDNSEDVCDGSSGSCCGDGPNKEQNASWTWLMMLDDDVFLHSQRLFDGLANSAPKSRFYAGQVWSAHFGHAMKSVRNPKHQSYLSEGDWALEEIPPFAIGQHYIVSFDCAKFVGNNAESLRGIGTLEDVSLALWLLAMGVKPQHVSAFRNARTFGCADEERAAIEYSQSKEGDGHLKRSLDDDKSANVLKNRRQLGDSIVFLSDITPAGLLMLQANLQEGWGLCSNYRSRWTKEPWRHQQKGTEESGSKIDGGITNLNTPRWHVVSTQIDSTNMERAYLWEKERDICAGVRVNVTSPVHGTVYDSEQPINLSVYIIPCSKPPNMPSFSAYMMCLKFDFGRGQKHCLEFSAATKGFSEELIIENMTTGTHVMWASVLAKEKKNADYFTIQNNEPVVFDTNPITHTEKVAESSLFQFSTNPDALGFTELASNVEVVASPVKVAILASNLEGNSQTAIFEHIATHLPIPLFDIHVFAPAPSFYSFISGEGLKNETASEFATISRLFYKLVPLHMVLLFDESDLGETGSKWQFGTTLAKYLGGVRIAEELLEPLSADHLVPPHRVREKLHSLVAELATFDLATVAWSGGLPSTAIFAECARLARRPRLILELPNKFPDLDRLPASVDALVAPSKYTLNHPTVRAFEREVYRIHHRKNSTHTENFTFPQQVIYPATLPPISARELEQYNSYDKTAEEPFVVAVVGRLALERSPGLMLHIIAALEDFISKPHTPLFGRSIHVLIAGGGSLLDILRSDFAPRLLPRWEQHHGGFNESDRNEVESLFARRSNSLLSLHWLGHVPHGMLLQHIFGRADAVLNACLVGETFGIANLEAVAAGVPVVAFAHGGNLESVPILASGVRCGKLVEAPYTPYRLAEALVDVLHPSSSSSSSSFVFDKKACVAQAHKIFGEERFIDRYTQFYQEVLLSNEALVHARNTLETSAIPFAGDVSLIGRLRVVLSDEAAYMKGLLESMLPRAFPKMFVDWNAIAADHVAEHMTTTLVVASALDGGCSDGWSVGCQKTLISIISSACPRDGGEGMRCLIIVAVSVPWDMTALPHALSSVGLNYRSALLLHAATAPELLPQKIRSLHLPVAASSFGERDAQKFSPMLLLSSSAERERKAGTLGDTNDEETTILARKHMFAAYLYYRCDRLDREEFFDALNMESGGRVSALGRCRGRSESFDNDETDARSTKATFMTRRFSRTWHDDSVALYAPYRFVVAFENHPDTDGYVTEKIVNAFLAGAIPIYRGPSDIGKYFNSRAFVNCGNFESLVACARYVTELDQDAQRIKAILSEPPVETTEQLERTFAWITGVPGNEKMALRLRSGLR